MLVLHVTYRVSNGTPKEFLAALEDCGIVSGSRAEEGNIMYEYFFPEGKPDILFLVEKWENEESFSRHIKTPHFKAADAVKEKYGVEAKLERYRIDRGCSKQASSSVLSGMLF